MRASCLVRMVRVLSAIESPAAALDGPSDLQCFRQALLVTIAFFVCYFALFTPSFQTNDDAEMCLAVLGEVTAVKPDTRIQFSHNLIGQVLVALGQISASVNWYGIYLLASHAVSVFALALLAFSPSSRPGNKVLFVLYLAVVQIHSLNSLQFTSTSTLAGTAGLLLILRGDVFRERPSRVAIGASGIALIVLSSMIRWHGLFLIVACLAPLIVVEFIRHWRAGNRNVFALLAVSGVLVGSARYAHTQQVNSDAEWKAARDQQQAAARLIDYKLLRFDEYRHVYASAGWTKTDYHLLNWYVLSDGDVFSTPVLTKFVEHHKPSSGLIPPGLLAGTAATVVLVCLHPVLLFANLLALAACIAWKGNRLPVALTLAAAFPLSYSILAVTHRCPVWVQYPVLTTALAVASVVAPSTDKTSSSTPAGRLWCCAAILIIGAIFVHRGSNQEVIKRNATSLGEIKALSTRNEEIYIAPVGFPLLSLPVLTREPGLSDVRIAFLATGQLYPWANKLTVDGQPLSIRGLVNSPSAAILIPKEFNGFGPAVVEYLEARFRMDVELKLLSRGKSFDVVSVVVKESRQQQE